MFVLDGMDAAGRVDDSLDLEIEIDWQGVSDLVSLFIVGVCRVLTFGTDLS